jgi:hypothetical protein
MDPETRDVELGAPNLTVRTAGTGWYSRVS